MAQTSELAQSGSVVGGVAAAEGSHTRK